MSMANDEFIEWCSVVQCSVEYSFFDVQAGLPMNEG